jgi:hypothetical protein
MSVDASWSAVSAQRRSQRIFLPVRLQVSGQANEKFTFEEETRTLAISAHGALMRLATAVSKGQELALRNVRTAAVEQCRVVYLSEPQAGGAQVGVEFLAPNPSFWNVSFPPEDWTARRSNAKQITSLH